MTTVAEEIKDEWVLLWDAPNGLRVLVQGSRQQTADQDSVAHALLWARDIQIGGRAK